MRVINSVAISAMSIALLFTSCAQNSSSTEESSSTPENNRLTSYVDPMIGTDGPGNTYPGATVPFGMVQLSPDNGIPGWDRIAGYFYPDSTIAGFSHTHLTGTGAGDLYDLLVMPTNSRFSESLTPDGPFRPYSKFTHDEEEAEPGYYAVNLKSFGIKAELTTTDRVGIHRYTFPKDESSSIILDLGFAMNWDSPVKTEITIVDNNTIEGYRWSKGWARDQRVFFVAKISKTPTSVSLTEDGKEVEAESTTGKSSRIAVNFSTEEGEQVVVKMALSNHSIAGARNNLAIEAAGWDFDKMRLAASDRWEEKLSTITIEGTEKQKQIFYSSLYHAHLAPVLFSDNDGKYGVSGETKTAEGWNRYDTFSLWDTFRAAHPLFTLTSTDKVDDMINSMLAHYKDHGELPVWSLAGKETFMMIGYHAVPVIVDAYIKGIKFDYELAYKACVESAMMDTREIDKYKRLGYVPVNEGHESWDVSKTLEYAYGDACIARFAFELNKIKPSKQLEEDYKYFSKRAENWRNTYDKVSTFMRPRKEDGSFITPFAAKNYHNSFCESNGWHYFWFVPQNIEGLISATGGVEPFTAKLDSMFTFTPATDDALPIFSTGMIGQYAHGNEPSHHVAYLYNYIDQPWKTQDMVRKIIESQYTTEPDGYCGNEDCGQMSAWLIFSSMGFYPVDPASAIYNITTPWVEKSTINLSNGKQFIVNAKGVSDKNRYIESISINGKPYDSLTLAHSVIMAGGTMDITVTDKPNKK